MQRNLQKIVDQHTLPEKAVWRGSKWFDHDSSHALPQQQLLVNNILNIHSSSVSRSRLKTIRKALLELTLDLATHN